MVAVRRNSTREFFECALFEFLEINPYQRITRQNAGKCSYFYDN